MAANGALSLGAPNEPTFKHKFTRSIAGPNHDFFTAVTSSGYIAFDWLGAQLSSPCDPLSGVDTEKAKTPTQIPMNNHIIILSMAYYASIMQCIKAL